MQARVTLHLLAKLEERHAAERELRALCHLRGQPERVSDQLVSAFIEAFNNVVIHAYRGREDGTVEVLLLLDDIRAVIEISDHGSSFDPHAVPVPKTPLAGGDELAEGGYGLHIIRSWMSHIAYYRDGDRNVLRMIKEFAGDSVPVSGI
jgi:serine/threonine-protein kinase RsbW